MLAALLHWCTYTESLSQCQYGGEDEYVPVLLFKGNLGFGVVVADNKVDLLEVHLLLLFLLQGDLDVGGVGGVGAASPALHLLRLRLFPLVLRAPVLEPDLHLRDQGYNCSRILNVFGYFVIMLLTTTATTTTIKSTTHPFPTFPPL